MADWKLPIDTLQALWHNAFPDLMQALWDRNRPQGEKPRGDTATRAHLPSDGGAMLDDSAALTSFFWWRFHTDGMRGALNPFKSGLKVSTSRALLGTFVVHEHGLMLPRLGLTPMSVVDFVDAGVSVDGPDDATLHAEIEKSAGSRSEWLMRGSQLDLLRAAASVATVQLWRDPDFGNAQNGFHEHVRAAYATLGGLSPRSLALNTEMISGETIKAWTNRGTTPTPYYNPEDGAGYFTPTGYTLFGPSPPPLLDALDPKGTGSRWEGTGLLCGGDFAPRHAYATVSTCGTCSAYFGLANREQGTKPFSESGKA